MKKIYNLIWKHIKKYKYIYTTCFFVFLAFLQFGLLSFHHNIWYDEAYQMVLNRYSFSKIIYFISNDFSGPLYALGLKVFTLIFGNELWIGRIFSLAIFSIAFLLAFYPIRRLFSYKTAIIFSILLLVIPINFFTAIEIRTYSLAFTATLGASVYAISFFLNSEKKDMILYIIFSVMALYSHNYGIFFIFILGNSLLLMTAIKKRTILKKVLLANFIIFVCFMPWIMTLAKQANNLDQKFWIAKPNWTMFPYTLSYLFGNYKNIYQLFFIMVLIGYIMTYILNIKQFYIALYYGLVLLLTIVFVICYSLYKSPIFYPKYLATFFGVFLLMCSIVFGNYKQNYLLVILFVILLIPMYFASQYEHKIVEEKNMKKLVTYVSSIIQDHKNKNIAFYHTGEFSLGVMEYYFPNSNHLIASGTDIYVTVPKIFGNVNFLQFDKTIPENIDTIIVCFPNMKDQYYLRKNHFHSTKVKSFYIPYSNNYYVMTVFEKNIS